MVLGAVGFRKFHRHLSEDRLEKLLRRSNLRQPDQCAPALSATANLADDPRNIPALARAATLLLAIRQLHSEIRTGALAPDRYRGQTLEMGQYANLFATSFVWDGRRQGLRIFKSTDTDHINIAIGGRFYSLDIGGLESESPIEPLQEALRELVDCTRTAPLPADERSLGLLTSAKIATQRKAFRLLQKEKENRETLRALRHSVATLCLDLDHRPASDAEAAHMAHSQNLANRWHHASLQLVVFGNAKACAIFNYNAFIDGNTMMRGAAEVQKRAARLPLQSGPRATPTARVPPAKELVSKVDAALLHKAGQELRSILDNQRATFEIPRAGRRFFKARNVEPVPAFIVALHMTIAHFTGGRSAKIEQHLTLSKYRCMGLATAVVTTPEVARFTQYISGNDVQHGKAGTLMRAAVDSQVRECRTARNHLPFSQLIPLFICYRKGLPRTLVTGVVMAASGLLGINWLSEVIVSHPSIFPEAPMLGRPGVRLPYVKYFGMHYQMLDDSIRITIMPALDWPIPNAELIAVLGRKLHDLLTILKNEHESTGAPDSVS